MATPNLDLENIELTDNMQTSLLEKMNGNLNKIDTAYNQLKNLLLQRTGKETLSEAINFVEQLVNANDGNITPDKVFNGYVGYAGQERIVGTALATVNTGSASQLLSGKTYYDNSGTLITGTLANKTGTSSAANGSVSGTDYRLQIPTVGYYSTNSYLTRPKTSVLSDLGLKTIPTISVTLSGTATATGYVGGYGAGMDNNGTLIIWLMSSSTAYENVRFFNTSIGAGTIGVGWDLSTSSNHINNPANLPHACTITGLGSYSNINIDLDVDNYNASYDYLKILVTLTAS